MTNNVFRELLFSLLPEGTQLPAYEEKLLVNGVSADDAYFMVQEKVKTTEALHHIIDTLIPLGLQLNEWFFQILCEQCRIDTVAYLYNKGIHVNLIDEYGENLFFKLCATRMYSKDFGKLHESFRKLEALGIDYKQLTIDGRNLIHKALRNDLCIPFIKFLASLDLNINLQDENGFTPLHLSADYSNSEMAAALLECGAEKSKSLRTRKTKNENEYAGIANLTPRELYDLKAPIDSQWRDEKTAALLT